PHRRYPDGAPAKASGGPQDRDYAGRQGARLVSGEGLRSRLRRAAIKARDPEIGAGSARRAHSLRQDQGRREGEDLRRSRRARLQRRDGGGGGGLTKNSPPLLLGRPGA